ncbi:hypothetical protein DAPPUDRAFT_240809 [Daphnia pulex]|uniref:Uncharacterized protein n=1 Tax=Daphnia pulex TaxID=6669 RepID=E9GCM1_DAPPU|nr:hypothetical protein DAPPUDRAFT_240809 [Daphnia pulex]|eukprot:EFX82582.1 hypothetical protein DAPPUDRAFT_240809 [Daphnia pulex]
MNISVCFLEKFFKKHARSPRTSLSQCWTEEGLPPTFCSILIFKTYAHTASLLQRFLCCYTSTFLASLASWITSVAVTHLQPLTKGLWPGLYAEETLAWTDGHQKVAGFQKCQRGSSFVVVNPLAATPLFPHVSSVARARAVRSRGLFASGSDSCTSPRFAERPC